MVGASRMKLEPGYTPGHIWLLETAARWMPHKGHQGFLWCNIGGTHPLSFCCSTGCCPYTCTGSHPFSWQRLCKRHKYCCSPKAPEPPKGGWCRPSLPLVGQQLGRNRQAPWEKCFPQLCQPCFSSILQSAWNRGNKHISSEFRLAYASTTGGWISGAQSCSWTLVIIT